MIKMSNDRGQNEMKKGGKIKEKKKRYYLLSDKPFALDSTY